MCTGCPKIPRKRMMEEIMTVSMLNSSRVAPNFLKDFFKSDNVREI